MNGSPVYVGGRGASRAKNENLIPVPIGNGKTLMVPSDDPSIQPIIQKLKESCMNIMSKKWPFLIFSALHAGNDPFLSTWRFSRGKDKEYIPSSDNYTQVHILKLLLFIGIDYAFSISSLRNEMINPEKRLRSEICRSTVSMGNFLKTLSMCIPSYLENGQSAMHFGACCRYVYTDNWHMMLLWDFSLGISQLTV